MVQRWSNSDDRPDYDCPDCSWAPAVDLQDKGFYDKYSNCFYWALMVSTGIGKCVPSRFFQAESCRDVDPLVVAGSAWG